MLKNIGIDLKGPYIDTMVATHLVNSSERSHSLDACCLRFLDYKKIPTNSILDSDKSMVNADIGALTNYACEDADLTFQLWEYLKTVLKETEQEKAFYEVEMPLINVLAEMEKAGI